ncbi:hypothetical protein [Mobiluncus mulieris]|uniref:hypothetical protein n=1 Tax=Mobiluncus mulieris TaxID=2052 RepID=UPI0011126566|nr:hypothetical protein [Mobiluncus mulieris]
MATPKPRLILTIIVMWLIMYQSGFMASSVMKNLPLTYVVFFAIGVVYTVFIIWKKCVLSPGKVIIELFLVQVIIVTRWLHMINIASIVAFVAFRSLPIFVVLELRKPNKSTEVLLSDSSGTS